MLWLPSGVSGQRVLVAPAAILSRHIPLEPLGLCCYETQSFFLCRAETDARNPTHRTQQEPTVPCIYAFDGMGSIRRDSCGVPGSRCACFRRPAHACGQHADMQRDAVPNTKRARAVSACSAAVRAYVSSACVVGSPGQDREKDLGFGKTRKLGQTARMLRGRRARSSRANEGIAGGHPCMACSPSPSSCALLLFLFAL